MKKTWDERHISLSKEVGSWSKDKSTKVGAAIVGVDNEIVSVGYNGFPRKVNDEIMQRHIRPDKYKWTEHAERNAIYNFARRFLKGCKIFLPWIPCSDCARAIIQCGIAEIITDNINIPERWKEDFKVSLIMLNEAGVKIRLVNSEQNLTIEEILNEK